MGASIFFNIRNDIFLQELDSTNTYTCVVTT